MQNQDHTTPNNCSRNIPPPPILSSSFRTTLLGVIHYLQGMECYHKGVPSGAIECYMCKYYPVDGDLKSQITCAINQALRFGFVQERKNYRYSLVHAVAGIYFAKQEDARQQELCYARHLFETVWSRCTSSPPECPENCIIAPPRKRRKPSCPSMSSSSDCGRKCKSRCRSRPKKKQIRKSCSKTCTKRGRPRRTRERSSSSSCDVKPSVKRKLPSEKKCSYVRIRGKPGACGCNCQGPLQRY